MISKNLWVVLSVVCFLSLPTLADKTITMVDVKANIKLQEPGDGEQEIETISAPRVTTLSGEEATVGVYSTFTNSVPNFEEHTMQTGKCGTIFRITPYVSGSDIFLKGNVEIRPAPIKSNDENGTVTTQDIKSIQFSLKLSEDKPEGTYRTSLPDGSTIIFQISASTSEQPAPSPAEKKEWSFQSNSADLFSDK